MKQTSNAQNNELLNLLRENVASKSIDEESPAENTSSAGMTSEQLLTQLKMQMGGASATNSDIVEDDYDISGFEIEEQSTADALEQPSLDAEEVFVEEEPQDDPRETPPAVEVSVAPEAEPEDNVPWECEDSQDSETEINEAEGSSSQEESIVDEIESPDEFDVSFTDATNKEEQEALKKQIELFVERTIEPEEVFDYFDGLEKKSAKHQKVLDEKKTVQVVEEPTTQEFLPSVDEAVDSMPGSVSLEAAILEESFSLSHEAEQFFFFTEDIATEEQDSGETVAEIIDDTDINLLLALGQKPALEQSIGFVRVREAKNNFYDPADEESLGNHIFAYNGEEFRDPSQADEIKTRYRKEKKVLWARLVGTMLLSLIALLVDYLHVAKMEDRALSDFFSKEINYHAIGLVLLLVGLLISHRRIMDGIKGFFTMRPNRFTPLSMIALTNVFYNVVILLFFGEASVSSYSFALLALLALSIIGDAIRLTKETLTFDIVASTKDKYALEKSDPSPEMSREEKILSKRDLLVEKVSFVGKYFARTARRPMAYTEYFIEYLVSIVIASFVTIGAAAIQKDLAAALNAFVATLLIVMPMQYLFGSYPLGRLAKLLYRHESAVIGEAVDREYVGANTVYLDDSEVFGLHGVSVSGLRTYNDANFYEVLYHANAVFSRMEGPLRHVFDNSAQEIEDAKEVTLIKIHANGIEASVDNKASVLIGNTAFMKSKNFKPKQTEEDDKKVERGEISILYMVVDGSLCAKFYMRHSITKRFETFANEMYENNTTVGIRTLDPSVSEEMIARLRKDKNTVISVVRPTLNDLVPIGRRSDSSIITAKNSHMIARILALCGRVKRINRLCSLLRIAAMVLSLVATCILLFTDTLFRVPSILIVVYHLLWLIPSSVYTATKLK